MTLIPSNVRSPVATSWGHPDPSDGHLHDKAPVCDGALAERDEQEKQLKRVELSLSGLVLEFVENVTLHRPSRGFTSGELDAYVSNSKGCAPGSATRILRSLRKKGLVNFEVVNRSKSIYRILP